MYSYTNNIEAWRARQGNLAIVENTRVTEEIERTSEKKVYFTKRFSSALSCCHAKFEEIANSSQTEDILESLGKTAALYGVTYLANKAILKMLKTNKGEEVGNGIVIAVVAIYAYLKSQKIKERSRQREIAKSFLRLFDRAHDIETSSIKIAEWVYFSHQLQIELMQKNSAGIGLFVNFLVDTIVREAIEDSSDIAQLDDDQNIRRIFEYINQCPDYWRNVTLKTEGDRSLDWTLGAVTARSPIIVMPMSTSEFELWNISQTTKVNYPREIKYPARVFVYKSDVVQKDNFTQRYISSINDDQNSVETFRALCADLMITEAQVGILSYQQLLHNLYLSLTDHFKAHHFISGESYRQDIFMLYVNLVFWCELNINIPDTRVLIANLLNISFSLGTIITPMHKENFKSCIFRLISLGKYFLRNEPVIHNQISPSGESEEVVEENSETNNPIDNSFQPDNYNWTKECGKLLLWTTGLDVHFEKQAILKKRLESMKEERLLAKRFTA